jgi:hypothetical protein
MFRIRDRRLRRHLLRMCDLTSGITGAQRRLPESHSPVCTENPIRVDGALESPKLAE